MASLAAEPASQADERPHGVASEELSAYEVLAQFDKALFDKGTSTNDKLDKAIGELSAPDAAAADVQLKPILDDYLTAIRLVRSSQLAAVDPAKLEKATRALAKATFSSASFETLLAAVQEQSSELLAAQSSGDQGKAALAAVVLANALTDVAYEWAAAKDKSR